MIDDADDLDLSGVDLTDNEDVDLKDLSQEEEAMKVLIRIARQEGLGEEYDDLIRDVYRQAVAAHDSGQGDSDAQTAGRTIYENLLAEATPKTGGSA